MGIIHRDLKRRPPASLSSSVFPHDPSTPQTRDLRLGQLLTRDEVSGHDFVHGELLIGNTGGGRKQLLADYEQMHQAPMVAHDDVVVLARERCLCGRGIGWIDAHLLASALVGRLRLWTADRRLATVARELGVAYE